VAAAGVKVGSASGDPQVAAIVGLGNPGRAYAGHRHNVGFMATDRLAERLGVRWTQKFNGNFARARLPGPVGDVDVTLLQPLGFMNLSGHSVQAMAAFFALPAEAILVVHDDLDLAFGRVQIKAGGGHGGHNGLRSIVAQLGGAGFVRVRIGIGRPGSDGGPTKGGDDAVSNWVLSNFGASDRAELPDAIDRAVAAIADVVKLGVRPAMNGHNRPPAPAAPRGD